MARRRHRGGNDGPPYEWKHGWIPLTHTAALAKAKGNRKLAQKYLPARAGGSTATRPRTSRPGEDPNFRRTGPELRDLAKRGDKGAQAELDRRAARKAAGGKAGGKRPGVPFRPTAEKTTPKTPTPRAAPKLSPADEVADARQRYGFASPQHLAAIERENAEIAANSGYVITTRRIEGIGDRPVLSHSVRTKFGESRIGSIVDRDNGGYEAKVGSPARPVGTYPDRQQAFRGVVRNHETYAEERRRAAEEKAAADARKAAANARRATAAAKSTGGAWEAYKFEGDGTRYGDAAAAKVKQAFRAGNNTVIIEAAMNRADTTALLADIRSIIDKSRLGDHDITFHVPTGDRQFRTTRRGTTGAYVRVGQATVFINPGIANNKLAAAFEAGGHSGHFMPAAKTVPARQYTLTHELGHVLDGIQGDTHRRVVTHTDSGTPIFGDFPQGARELHREHRGELSKYGTTNLQEGYAEAFAQWVHGGPGSSRVADAYARRFGWPTPRS